MCFGVGYQLMSSPLACLQRRVDTRCWCYSFLLVCCCWQMKRLSFCYHSSTAVAPPVLPCRAFARASVLSWPLDRDLAVPGCRAERSPPGTASRRQNREHVSVLQSQNSSCAVLNACLRTQIGARCISRWRQTCPGLEFRVTKAAAAVE